MYNRKVYTKILWICSRKEKDITIRVEDYNNQ